MRRVAAVTACLLCLSAATGVAHAAVREVIKGAGFGHGIGLSQYGAYGYALHGRSYQQILAHYYKGTRLSRAPSRPVRVILQPNDPYIRVRGATRSESAIFRRTGPSASTRRMSGTWTLDHPDANADADGDVQRPLPRNDRRDLADARRRLTASCRLRP